MAEKAFVVLISPDPGFAAGRRSGDIVVKVDLAFVALVVYISQYREKNIL